MLELTAEEIDKKCFESDVRQIKSLPFRYVPRIVAETSRQLETERALRYVLNAFYIYRASIEGSMFALHYEVDGAYEWPAPVKFSWSSVDAILIGGDIVNKEVKNPRVEAEIGGRIEVTEITEEGKKTFFREIERGRDNACKMIKYRIDDLSKVASCFSDFWQLESLRVYANPAYFLLERVTKRQISKENARRQLESLTEKILGFMTGNF